MLICISPRSYLSRGCTLSTVFVDGNWNLVISSYEFHLLNPLTCTILQLSALMSQLSLWSIALAECLVSQRRLG